MKDKGAVGNSPPLSHPNGSPPKLAEGIELMGEYKDSGFKQAPYLARRADGQVLQLPRLLYLVAENSDGQRDYSEIAQTVTEKLGKGVSADNVRFLADSKLRPLGVLAAADGSSPKLRRPNPLLALNFRASVIPPGLVNALTTVFRPFFWPVVVGLALAGFAALDAWLFFAHGVAQGLRSLLDQPVFFLLVFALVVLSAALHEIGHATGCRYGGARPGVMGVGLYLVWPAFYTDVTDAYRLGKGGRLRTDLGGVYFNALFMLGTIGLYVLTHAEILIVVVLFLQFEMLHQFLPFLRLDGYYVVADLTGVPDIFSRIRPVIASFNPFRKSDKRVTELKPWVRVVVTLWVVFAAGFLLYAYGMMLLHLPTIAATAVQSFTGLLGKTVAAGQDGQIATAVFNGLQLLLLALPSVGLAITLLRLVQRLLKAAWTKSQGKPFTRVTYFLAMAAAIGLLLVAWLPRGQYMPIKPSDRGTVSDSFVGSSQVLAPFVAPLASPSAVPSATASASSSPTPEASASSTAPATSASAAASPTPSTSP